MLNWKVESLPCALVGKPEGRIDESNWQAFSDALVAAIADAKGRRLIIDLASVDYMSSRGLRALSTALASANTNAVPMVLAGPGAAMRQILAISRYDKLFSVYDDVAVAAL